MPFQESLQNTLRGPTFIGISIGGGIIAAFAAAGVVSVPLSKIILICVWTVLVAEVSFAKWFNRTKTYKYSLLLFIALASGIGDVYLGTVIANMRYKQDEAARPQPALKEPQHEELKKESPKIESPTTTKKKLPTKSVVKSEPPAFAVAVETKMMVPSPSKDIAGTGLWALSRLGTTCYLRSVDTAMFVRIKNLQSEKIMITAYNVYAMGEELPRIRMDMNSPFLVLKTGVIPRNFQGVIPFQMPAPSGNAGGGFFDIPFKDSDFSAAATVQAELLDRQLGEHYIEPGATVRGWAFFEYNRGTFLPIRLTIKISDDLGHNFSYDIPDEPGNPSGDTLQRLLNFGPTVDLSSCTRQPHLALSP